MEGDGTGSITLVLTPTGWKLLAETLQRAAPYRARRRPGALLRCGGFGDAPLDSSYLQPGSALPSQVAEKVAVIP